MRERKRPHHCSPCLPLWYTHYRPHWNRITVVWFSGQDPKPHNHHYQSSNWTICNHHANNNSWFGPGWTFCLSVCSCFCQGAAVDLCSLRWLCWRWEHSLYKWMEEIIKTNISIFHCLLLELIAGLSTSWGNDWCVFLCVCMHWLCVCVCSSMCLCVCMHWLCMCVCASVCLCVCTDCSWVCSVGVWINWGKNPR